MNGCSVSGSSRVLAALAMLVVWPVPGWSQWLPTGTPLGGSVVALASDSQYIYAGTSQGKVWRRPLADLVSAVRAGTAAPRVVPGGDLSSFPNPCNASAVFEFTFEQEGEGTLRLYDMLGRCALTLFDGRIAAGGHRWPANLSLLPSGVYLAVLRAGTTTATQRVVLIR